ncbi:AarF/ABC1/UbiB kinase family protein [Candidatus Woesearchaeota archaeon]|nr:AarF/ABC1/UbiB kinase family protein [Candidatus Woesearchaeota archaeon]
MIKEDMRDFGRFYHVLNVLFKNRLGYFLEKHGLHIYLPFHKKLMRHKFIAPLKPEVRWRQAFEELGGTFVKLGQLLSLRPDLVPFEYCEEFQKLQDDVPAFPFSEVKKIVEKELKKPLNKIFRSFNETPIGSASIGQVHEAVLKNNKKVVVKVQRPHIDQIMRADIDILYTFAKMIEKGRKFSNITPTEIMNEFEKYTKKELDYVLEGRNIDQFYQNFENSKTIKIPKVYLDYTTSRVLTMEYIKGTKLKDMDDKKIDRKLVEKIAADAILKQVFEDGFFHADLHPGNILLTGHKIAFLDFGIVGYMSKQLKNQSLDLFIALLEKDSREVKSLLMKIGKSDDAIGLETFEDEITEVINEWRGAQIRQMNITSMLRNLLNLCFKHNIKMPANIILFAKALITLEGSAKLINPEFDINEYAEPYVKKILANRARPSELIRAFLKKGREIKEILDEFPEKAKEIIDKAAAGKIKLDIEDEEIKKLGFEIDKSSNRLALGMIIGAIVIGMALLMKTQYESYAFAGMAVVFVLGAVLIISILREGKY